MRLALALLLVLALKKGVHRERLAGGEAGKASGERGSGTCVEQAEGKDTVKGKREVQDVEPVDGKAGK